MNLIFEIIIDFITTIFIGNADNIIKNKTISKWVRYPIIFVSILLCILVTFVPIILGIILLNKNIIASIIFILIGTIFTIGIIFEIKKIIKEKSAT